MTDQARRSGFANVTMGATKSTLAGPGWPGMTSPRGPSAVSVSTPGWANATEPLMYLDTELVKKRRRRRKRQQEVAVRSLIPPGRMRIEDDEWRRRNNAERRIKPKLPTPPPVVVVDPIIAVALRIDRALIEAARSAYEEARAILTEEINFASQADHPGRWTPKMTSARPKIRMQSLTARGEYRMDTRWNSMWESTFGDSGALTNRPAGPRLNTPANVAKMKAEYLRRRGVLDPTSSATSAQKHEALFEAKDFGRPVGEVPGPDPGRRAECIAALESVLEMMPAEATKGWSAPGVVLVGPSGWGNGRPCPLPVELGCGTQQTWTVLRHDGPNHLEF